MWSTPIHAMEAVTILQPFQDKLEIKEQAAKFKRLQDHLMHEHMNLLARGD